MFFNKFFNTLNKSIFIRNVDIPFWSGVLDDLLPRYLSENVIAQLFTFQISVISGCDDNKVYKVLSVKKKSLKVVINTTDDIGL